MQTLNICKYTQIQYVTKAQYIEILIGLKDGSSTGRLLILRQGFKDL